MRVATLIVSALALALALVIPLALLLFPITS
jgi:hypothetical protein